MTDKNNSEYLQSGAIKPPRLGWSPIIIHLMFASIVLWCVFTFGEYLGVKYWLDIITGVIPSIAGIADISPNPGWAKAFMFFCWAGAPYYIYFLEGGSYYIY